MRTLQTLKRDFLPNMRMELCGFASGFAVQPQFYIMETFEDLALFKSYRQYNLKLSWRTMPRMIHR